MSPKNQKLSSRNIIPLPPKGTSDISGYGKLSKDVEKINTRMEVVVIALLIAFVVGLISVFGLFIDAYKFHAESYDKFVSTINESGVEKVKIEKIEKTIADLVEKLNKIEAQPGR